MNKSTPSGPYGVVTDAEVMRGAVRVPTESCPKPDEAVRVVNGWAYCNHLKSNCPGFSAVERLPGAEDDAKVVCKYARPAKASSSPTVASAEFDGLTPITPARLTMAASKAAVSALSDRSPIASDFRLQFVLVPTNRSLLVQCGGLTPSEVANLSPESVAMTLSHRLSSDVLRAVVASGVAPKQAVAGLLAYQILKFARQDVTEIHTLKAALSALSTAASNVHYPVSVSDLLSGDAGFVQSLAERIRAGA